MNPKIPVAILGATGSVGQRFVQLLDNHPWFELVALTGSDRSLGQRYGQACHWILPEPMPERASQMLLLPSEPEFSAARIAFSALPSALARQIEPRYAQAGVNVCSNASAYRQEDDVPLLLPEVNAEHAGLVPFQRQQRGWSGCIVTNPNCTSTGLTVALKALRPDLWAAPRPGRLSPGDLRRGLSRRSLLRYRRQCRPLYSWRRGKGGMGAAQNAGTI